MSEQPEALRVAHELECRALINEISLDDDFVMELDAARLLREQHAEIERLRADAARYRYLKDRAESYDGYACFPDVRYVAPIPDCSPFCPVDAAVDAAMKEDKP